MDQLEDKGMLGFFQGLKLCEVLIANEEELKKRLNEIMNENKF